MALTDAQFRSLSAHIAELVGIHIGAEKRWLLAARVTARLAAVGETNERRYVEHVIDPAGAEELGHLVEALRVGETQFYRHASQLRAIRRVALPEIIARRERDGTRTVRVWSAGCATGEEPYTLAMMLDAALRSTSRLSFEILATDLSGPALDVARRGRYRAGATRAVPREVMKTAFVVHGDEVEVRPALRQRIRFEEKNLLDARYPRGFDLVLCRNVLIYFGRATQREVLARLSASVVPGGYLALGYTERLDAGDGELLPLRTDDGVLYRRADGATRVVVPKSEPKAELMRASGATLLRRDDALPRRTSRPPSRPQRPGERIAREPGDRPARDRSAEAETATRSAGQDTAPPHLEGELTGDSGALAARAAVAPLLAGVIEPPVLSVAGLIYADREVSRILARAAAAIAAHGTPLSITGASEGVRRFLVRSHVVPPAVLTESSKS